MKKFRIIGFISVLLLFSNILVSCGSENQSNIDNSKYYQLKYYDQLSDEYGYNRELFYQNQNMFVGADPSVVYGKGSDGENHFYVYPTGNQYRFYAYQSDDLGNWHGVGDIFIPEKESWIGGAMWAPDIIYDAEVDDGQGGKGLYYLFFSASDSVRSSVYNGKFFESREAKNDYLGIVNTVNSMSNDEINAILDFNGKTLEEKSTELINKYNVPSDYEYVVINELSAYYIDSDIEVAKKALIAIMTTNNLALYGSSPYAGCIATAKTLDGPFIQYVNDGSDGNRKIDISSPFLTHEDLYPYLSSKYQINKALTIVDMHAFVDPENGDKYMYFNSSALATHSINSTCEIFVVKVGDKNSKWTDDWQWDTLVQLTRTGYKNMTEVKPTSDLSETAINEGAYVLYCEENQKYYLTMSKGRWQSNGYAVLQAVSDSPMGPFEKIPLQDGGMLLKSTDNVVGPGHHSFVTYNGKTYIVYHQHIKLDCSANRAVSVDEVKWVKNNKDEYVLYVNGPTRSPQVITANSEYSNIAPLSTVSITNGNGATTDCLTDELYGADKDIDFVKEFSTKQGKCEIKFTFEDYKQVKAISIYNSKDVNKSFTSVKRIELDFIQEDGSEGIAYIDNLAFNSDYFYTNEIGESAILPCSSAIAEFKELKVKEIRVIFDGKPVNISEIMILGK